MSEHNPIKVFVSHMFEADVDYLRVFEYLESVDRFYYMNVSDPETMPDGGAEGIKAALRDQIAQCEAVILLASLHATNRDWVEFQLNAAKALNKPIVLMQSFGQTTMMPGDLATKADEVVAWNERELVDAIKRQARHEDTARWEVIDFP